MQLISIREIAMERIKIMKLINSIQRSSATIYNKRLENYGIRKWEHPYILKITNNPGITQEELAHSLHVNPSTVTRQLSLLESEGLIEKRTDSEDRRISRIYPTDRMLELKPHAVHVMMDLNDQIILKDFSDEDKKTAYALLERMTENAAREAEKHLG